MPMEIRPHLHVPGCVRFTSSAMKSNVRVGRFEILSFRPLDKLKYYGWGRR
jgi:hypothetical protein